MISPARGTLLIANPFLKDPNFMRTVIFLCEHKEEGSFGFVLNKLFPKMLGDLLPEFDEYAIPLYFGGPVQKDTIHFLHQYPNIISGGEEVFEGVYWGGNFESAMALIKNKQIDFRKIKFFIGYSGWAEKQIDDEMKVKSWLITEATRNLLFHSKPDNIWKDSLKHLGGEYEMMINFPIDPQLN
ncbi:MAG: YqgE/AlgH family protein [Ginsengibacter sp.]